MAGYDRALLQKLANDLYRRAALVLVLYVLSCLALGGALGYTGAMVLMLRFGEEQVAGMAAVLGGVTTGAFGLLGWALGSAAAFRLRVQAQQTLWMLEVERKIGKP